MNLAIDFDNKRSKFNLRHSHGSGPIVGKYGRIDIKVPSALVLNRGHGYLSCSGKILVDQNRSQVSIVPLDYKPEQDEQRRKEGKKPILPRKANVVLKEDKQPDLDRFFKAAVVRCMMEDEEFLKAVQQLVQRGVPPKEEEEEEHVHESGTVQGRPAEAAKV